IENADASAHGLVLRQQTPGRRILDGHVPAVKIDHFRAQTAMQRVERCVAGCADDGRVGCFHSDGSGQKSILACTPKRVKEAESASEMRLTNDEKSLSAASIGG